MSAYETNMPKRFDAAYAKAAAARGDARPRMPGPRLSVEEAHRARQPWRDAIRRVLLVGLSRVPGRPHWGSAVRTLRMFLTAVKTSKLDRIKPASRSRSSPKPLALASLMHCRDEGDCRHSRGGVLC